MRRDCRVVLVTYLCLAFTTVLMAQSMPQIQQVDYSSRAPGASECMYGVGFGTSQGTNTLAVNATQITGYLWSDTKVCFNIPSSTAAGAATIQVTTAGGTSNAFGITVVSSPLISSVSPNAAAPGAQVTVTGSNFGTTQDQIYLVTSVAYLSMTVQSWTATQIVATLPTTNVTPGSATVLVSASGVSNQHDSELHRVSSAADPASGLQQPGAGSQRVHVMA